VRRHSLRPEPTPSVSAADEPVRERELLRSAA
jgi:hypothetical protein